MQDKQLRIKILCEIDEYNHRLIDYADFANRHNCNLTEVRTEFATLVSNGFISGAAAETTIRNPSITPAGAKYIKDNTLQLPPVRRRMSDLFWTVLTHGCTLLIGFLLGLFTAYFMPNIKPQENHNAERTHVETSERVIIPSAVSNSTDNDK
ncbi:hypothetical protein FACS189427_07160 [Planctomycetales bacterium]|nr:hypothetical protein FACS189427_07160 [Planctomycetales bacterium]